MTLAVEEETIPYNEIISNQVVNYALKFDHLQSKWEEFIDVSFIQETTKERYKELIHENWKRIK